MISLASVAGITAFRDSVSPTQLAYSRVADACRVVAHHGLKVLFLIACATCSFPSNVNADGVIGPLRKPILLPLQSALSRGVLVRLDIAEQTVAGYVPVRITLQGAPRFAADRRFVIQFRNEAELESPPQNGMVVDVPVMAPQGATSEVLIRYLPKWSAGQAVSVTVSEGGRALDGYATFFGGDKEVPAQFQRYNRRARSGNRFLDVEYGINYIYISPLDQAAPESMPDLWNAFAGLHPVYQAVPGANGLTEFVEEYDWSGVISGAEFHALGQADLPDDWRGYQNYDIILLDPESLAKLSANAGGLDAVRNWVLNGGTVLVYNAESPKDAAAKLNFTWHADVPVDSYLDAIAREQRYVAQQSRNATSGFSIQLKAALKIAEAPEVTPGDGSEVNLKLLEQRMVQAGISDSIRFEPYRFLGPVIQTVDPNAAESTQSPTMAEQVQAYITELKQQLKESQRSQDALDQELKSTFTKRMDQFQVRHVGAGQLIVMEADPETGMPSQLDWNLVPKMLDYRASPTLRRGVDPLLGDRRFRRWAIPGVAQPPVYTFMGLLTLFVILVGPVAYRRTSKIGRSYLMFAIAPILALVTTAAMFGYGIVSDGFGTLARVRQLTWVDGQSGDAGERVRSTYFAGVRPSDGIRFGGDAEVMVYPEGTGQSWDSRENLPSAELGRVVVEADSQRLDATFLPSREQRQFVVHSPRKGIGYLSLTPDPDGLKPPTVKSTFDFEIEQAVVRDDKGVYWQIDNLGAGAQQATVPLTVRDASKLLGSLYTEHRPLSAVRETSTNNRRYNNEIYDVILDTNRRLETRVAVNDGTFEHWLQTQLQSMGEIPNLHFVGIAEVSPDVLLVESPELRSSIRYVFGTLR